MCWKKITFMKVFFVWMWNFALWYFGKISVTKCSLLPNINVNRKSCRHFTFPQPTPTPHYSIKKLKVLFIEYFNRSSVFLRSNIMSSSSCCNRWSRHKYKWGPFPPGSALQAPDPRVNFHQIRDFCCKTGRMVLHYHAVEYIWKNTSGAHLLSMDAAPQLMCNQRWWLIVWLCSCWRGVHRKWIGSGDWVKFRQLQTWRIPSSSIRKFVPKPKYLI